MIALGNPWGLLALATIAIPAIIHLLGRRRTRVVKFPSVRFLTTSRMVPTRRTRLHDLPLLIVRVAVLSAAAVALARPLLLTGRRSAARAGALSRLLARVIIVDTSASMHRRDSAGEPAVAAARRRARAFASGATASTVIEAAQPSRELPGASDWLGKQSGRREVVIVSDFQIGAVDSLDLARIPKGIGVTLAAIALAPQENTFRTASGNRIANVTLSLDQSVIDWGVTPARSDSAHPLLLAGPGDTGRASATLIVARALGATMRSDSARPIAIIYKEYPGRSSLAANAMPIDQPWMGDAIARLHAMTTLTDAAMTAVPTVDASLANDRFSVVARDAAGSPVIVASVGDVGRRRGLQFWVLSDAGSRASAALLASLPAAISPDTVPSEFEPNTVPAVELARWQRPAGPDASTDPHDESDARWLWLLALALLAVESYLRRPRHVRLTGSAVVESDEAHRVA